METLPDVLEEVPGYSALEPVGRGGFSVVYRARQVDLDRAVALKVLLLDPGSGEDARRFRRERQLLVRLGSHPHVVTVFDTGTTRSRRPFIAMEYYERGSLQDRLAEEGPLPVDEVLDIGVKIAGALAAVHDEGVVHRDVKPRNVLVSRYGEPALADFGIAAMAGGPDVSASSDQFTVHHVAPEVLEGRPPSAAADVYGLGSTLYTLLAGRAPHQRAQDDGIAPLLLRVLHEEPAEIARPDLPSGVMTAIRTAMARRPEDRFPSARAFGERLRELRSELDPPALPDAERTVRRSVLPPAPALEIPAPAAEPPAPVRPGRAWRLLAGGTVAACLGLGLLLVLFQRPAPAPPPRPAPPRASRVPVPTPTAPAPAPVPTLAPGLVDAARPAGVSATDAGSTIVLHWAPGADQYPLVVQRSSPGGRAALTALPQGATSATVGGLDPAAGYCFQVGAVVAVGQPSTVAWSSPVCVRGAVPAPSPRS